jgi:hypothetical protein
MEGKGRRTSRTRITNRRSTDLRTYIRPSRWHFTTSICIARLVSAYVRTKLPGLGSGVRTHQTKLAALQRTHELEVRVLEAQRIDLDRLGWMGGPLIGF